jgi:hypothetical protein
MDGYADIVLETTTLIRVMYGNGDGTFQPPVTLVPNTRFLRIRLAGDVDGDGDVDLVGVSRPGFDEVVAILRNDSGTFNLQVIDSGVVANRTLEQLADVDGDGLLDLLGLDGNGEDIWYRNLGDLTFERRSISHWCEPVEGPYTAIDVDGDGDLDMVRFHGGIPRMSQPCSRPVPRWSRSPKVRSSPPAVQGCRRE